eukprot:TRINITY_DN7600_c0_g2_i1.p1 TRINITY_DN7600_c0_g2~~TRINITY_DN7600_c0_g2_i1.p1  ORF type:complete len:450 (+),score=74.69 TRINITY_DN7600_c0_g2_i1:74-1423(+)
MEPLGAVAVGAGGPWDLADFAKDAHGTWCLKEHESALQEVAKAAAPHAPVHVVGFIGDAGAGKSFLIDQLRLPTDDAGEGGGCAEEDTGDEAREGSECSTSEEVSKGTCGVRLYQHDMQLRHAVHRLMFLDTEGLNANSSSDVSRETEEYSLLIEKRPAVLQLLPNLVYKACDVLVYVWGAEHQNPSQETPAKQAYQHCLEAVRPPMATMEEDAENAPKPALLVVLNRQPVRKCVTLPVEGDDPAEFLRIRVDECTHELLALETHDMDRKLSRHFSSVMCLRVPLKESRWGRRGGGKGREGITGLKVLPEAVGSLRTTINALLKATLRRAPFPRVHLSALGWATAFPQFVHGVNAATNRWGPTQPPKAADVMHCNATAFSSRSRCAAHNLPRCCASDCTTAAECCQLHHAVTCAAHNAPACISCMMRFSELDKRLQYCCRRHHRTQSHA